MPDDVKQAFKRFCLAFAASLLFFLAAASGMQLWGILASDRHAQASYAEAQAVFRSTVSDTNAGAAIDWPALQTQYPGIIGWLSCPDTGIDYPLMQCADNDYYLAHLADGSQDRHGAIFVDCRNAASFKDAHTLVYGHNMNDGTMFHGLLNWGNAEYAAAHPSFFVYTPNGDYEVLLYNACLVEPTNEVYDLACANDKAGWLDRCAKQSWFRAGFAPSPSEPVVTFSTCTDSAHRFVVQGVVRPL